MPIIKSAKKRAIQNEKRSDRLRPFKTKMLTMVKNIRKWVKEKDLDKAKKFLSETVSTIDTAVKKNIIHKNNAARKKSQVQKLVNTLEKEPVAKETTAQKAAPKKATPAKTAVKKVAPKTTAKKTTAAKKTTTTKKTTTK